MLHSAEIRWFLPESGLHSLATLFPKSPPGDPMNWQETRTDVYRVIPGADIIGLKLRGHGGLQLKALRAAPEPFRWTPPASPNASTIVLGQTDQWVKWGLPEANGHKILPGATEVRIQKVRWTRKFSAGTGRLVPVPGHEPTPFPASGCNVERTELTLGHEQWLSLGFEAFGDPSRLPAILAEAVATVLAQATATEIATLATARSQSYPVWLDTYVTRMAPAPLPPG